MYFEKAEVKTYYRNYKNKKVPYNQIHLKKDSEFNKNPEETDVVAVINISDFEDLLEKSKTVNSNEYETKYNELLEENLQLEKELKAVKATVESLTSEKLELQQDLLTEKNNYESLVERTNSKLDVANVNVIEAKDKIEQLQKEHKEEINVKDSEIAKLNYKLNNEKDLTKSLLVVRSDLLNRSLINRIRNKEPESSKIVAELKELPEFNVKDISKK